MITTHVLDVSRGRPAAGIRVTLERQRPDESWESIGQGETDNDGRLRNMIPADASVPPGVYRLNFETRRYFEQDRTSTLYPHVTIVFETVGGQSHYHVPLLISPFGYTTYRGT